MKRLVLFGTLLISTAYAIASVSSQPQDVKKFEATGQCPACDLSGASLSDMSGNFTLSLSKANLVRANLSPLTYNQHQNSDMSGIIGIELYSTGIDYTGSNFTGANLTNANLSYSNFSQVNFSDANLQGAKVDNANLYGAKLTTAQLASLGSECKAILPDGSIGKCN